MRNLGDGLDLTDRADHRVGSLERAEPSLTLAAERGEVVVADPAGARLGERRSHGCGRIRRHEDRELVERLADGGDEGLQVGQAERPGHGLGDAVGGLVGVGVRGQQRAAGSGEGREGASLRRRRGETVHRLEEQRVVHDEQVGLPVGCLFGHCRGRVDGEHHLPDRLLRIAVDEADGVPVLRGGRRVPLMDQGDDVREPGHVRQPTGEPVRGFGLVQSPSQSTSMQMAVREPGESPGLTRSGVGDGRGIDVTGPALPGSGKALRSG